jgi:hypothetical protein
MSIIWFVLGMIACLFLPSPVSSWGRKKIKALWSKIFQNNEQL